MFKPVYLNQAAVFKRWLATQTNETPAVLANSSASSSDETIELRRGFGDPVALSRSEASHNGQQLTQLNIATALQLIKMRTH